VVDTGIPEWITGIIIANVVAWSVLLGMVSRLLNRVKHTEHKTDQSLTYHKKLIEMHEHADEYTFGTGTLVSEIRAMNKDQRRSNRELIHLMSWFVEQTVGKKPPPYNDDLHKGNI